MQYLIFLYPNCSCFNSIPMLYVDILTSDMKKKRFKKGVEFCNSMEDFHFPVATGVCTLYYNNKYNQKLPHY